MINNIHKIKSLLNFESEDDFYHLQIIKRKKEHTELGSNSYVVKTYYISSSDYLDKKFSEIQSLCNFHNARAYINLNVRSFERMAFQTLKKITDQIMNKDYRSVRKSYESACGEFGTGRDKKWIIDLDRDDLLTQEENDALVKEVISRVIQLQQDPLAEIIPTKNGVHLITRPFPKQLFKREYPLIEIHINNPTLLYIL